MASIHRSQLRLAQITGSFKATEIVDTLGADSGASLAEITIPSGSMVGVMSEVVSAIKRIHGAGTFAKAAAGEFSQTIKPATDDGAALGSANNNWSDLFLADSAVINLGDDQEVTLTHIPDVGVRLGAANKLEFRDSDLYISSSANGVLDVGSDTTLNLNIGTTTELALNASTATFGTNIRIPNNGTIGSAGATGAITVAADGIVTFADDIKIKDAGTIGNASVADVMTLAADGIVTFKDDILLKNDGTIGSTGTAAAITIKSDGDLELAKDLQIAGTVIDVDSASALTIGATVGANALTLGAATSEVVIPGSLVVQGATTTLTSSNTVIQDSVIGLATSGSDGYGPSAQSRGLVFGGGALGALQQTMYYDGTGAFVFGSGNTSPASASFGTPAAANYTTIKAGDLDPGASNTYALGSTALQWSDAFLGDGAVLNFNNGNVTLTHSTNALTISDADKLQFRNANVSLQSSADGVLSIEASSGIETDSAFTASIGAHFDGEGPLNAVVFGAGKDFQIEVSSDDALLANVTSGKDIIFLLNSSSIGQELARFDASAGTFAMKASNTAGTNGGVISFNGTNDQHEAVYGANNALFLRSNNVSFKMATADGSDGHFLKTDGAGVLSFASAGSVTAARQQVISATPTARVPAGTALRSGAGLGVMDVVLGTVTKDECDNGMTVFVNGQMLLSGSTSARAAGTVDYNILDGSTTGRISLQLGFDLLEDDVVQVVLR